MHSLYARFRTASLHNANYNQNLRRTAPCALKSLENARHIAGCDQRRSTVWSSQYLLSGAQYSTHWQLLTHKSLRNLRINDTSHLCVVGFVKYGKQNCTSPSKHVHLASVSVYAMIIKPISPFLKTSSCSRVGLEYDYKPFRVLIRFLQENEIAEVTTYATSGRVHVTI